MPLRGAFSSLCSPLLHHVDGGVFGRNAALGMTGEHGQLDVGRLPLCSILCPVLTGSYHNPAARYL